MSHPDAAACQVRPSPAPNTRAESDDPPVRALLGEVHRHVVGQLLAAGLGVAWGPDHERSSDPAAARLRDRKLSFDWVAVTFPGWSLWHLHVGLVPRGPGVLALGLHWHDSVQQNLPPGVAGLGARAIGTSFFPESGEHQADVLVLAWTVWTRRLASQALAESTLELALAVHAPLAIDPATPPSIAQGAPHDM